MKLTVELDQNSYPIVIEKDCTLHLNEWIDTKRKTLLVHDSGIPDKWVKRVADQLENGHVFCFEQGEESKNLQTLEQVLQAMVDAGLNRKSQVIALGGGVTGDMAGFAAAVFMRGIDFINIPTTVLSQVDSSVGGKTAVDLGSVKNIVGAFWQPKAVLIDPVMLETLSDRQIANGLAEALKMGVLFDEDLVEEFEKEKPDIEKIIARSIDLKRIVVEQDEKETGPRKLLNFGHTIGHAIEGSFEGYEYLHGECVATGMLYFIDNEALKKRIMTLEEKIGLPRIEDFDHKKALELLTHDKKGTDTGVDCVFVNECGKGERRHLSIDELKERMERNVYEKHDRNEH